MRRRLTITGGLFRCYALRFDGVILFERDTAEAIKGLKARAEVALMMLADTLAKPSLNKEANRGH